MKTIARMLLWYFLAVAIIALAKSATTISTKVELHLYPVLGEFTATDWKFDSEDRFWSAKIYGTKVDNDCVYVPGQKVNGVATIAPGAPAFELLVEFLKDDTPDSSRPAGYQYFGRWQFDAPNIPKGTSIKVRLRHKCTHRKEETPSIIGPFIVGLEK